MSNNQPNKTKPGTSQPYGANPKNMTTDEKKEVPAKGGQITPIKPSEEKKH